jgi:hydrogenase maturation protease
MNAVAIKRAGGTVPPHVLVIGYGNPLRGDDGVGWHAAEALSAMPEARVPHELEILTTQQLTPELAADIARARLVIFVDASIDHRPGEIACRHLGEPRPLTNAALGPRSAPSDEVPAHVMRPETLLCCASVLYGARPSACLFAVGVGSCAYGCELSEPVHQALPALARQIAGVVDWWEGRLPKCPRAGTLQPECGRFTCTN